MALGTERKLASGPSEMLWWQRRWDLDGFSFRIEKCALRPSDPGCRDYRQKERVLWIINGETDRWHETTLQDLHFQCFVLCYVVLHSTFACSPPNPCPLLAWLCSWLVCSHPLPILALQTSCFNQRKKESILFFNCIYCIISGNTYYTNS